MISSRFSAKNMPKPNPHAHPPTATDYLAVWDVREPYSSKAQNMKGR